MERKKKKVFAEWEKVFGKQLFAEFKKMILGKRSAKRGTRQILIFRVPNVMHTTNRNK